ncbi:MAG: glycosyltransferase family 4 protein [Bacteroidota bacterium]
MEPKRVLLICYYWPPAGGPGVQRWLKFVKYFREFGVDPVVFVPENPHYPMIDESFAAEVPSEVEILKLPIKEPYRFATWFSRKKTKAMSSGIISEKNPSLLEKLLLFVRGNLFIPDARIGWVKPAVAYLKKYLDDSDIQTVITTGPPHSLHLIGKRLQADLGLQWIADFRDPWTTIHYHRSLRLTRASREKHKRMEREVLTLADAIVVTSPNTKKEFSEITNTPITVITNGFDASEIFERVPDDTFTLVHVGSLLSNRNPIPLWKVLSELCTERTDFKDALSIKLVGAVGDEIKESLQEFELKELASIPGYVSHSEALKIQQNAQVLLLIEMDRPETAAIIPGKLFEYLKARRPIIAMGPEGSDISAIIEETESGRFFGYRDEKILKEQILSYFHSYLTHNLNEGSRGAIEKYSRRELTGRMAQLIKNLQST